jgi:hypothetical protein
VSAVTTPPQEAPPGVSEIEAGVISDARRRQRRRRAGLLSALLVMGAGAYVAFGPGHGASHPASARTGPPRPSLVLDANALFSQSPYMGVACHIPSSIACDRIGLTVWLRRPALTVTATISGRSFALENPMWSGPARHGLRTQFAGFLQPAGITSRLGVTTERGAYWDGSGTPAPLVMLEITRPGQAPVQAWTNVPLMAGWG